MWWFPHRMHHLLKYGTIVSLSIWLQSQYDPCSNAWSMQFQKRNISCRMVREYLLILECAQSSCSKFCLHHASTGPSYLSFLNQEEWCSMLSMSVSHQQCMKLLAYSIAHVPLWGFFPKSFQALPMIERQPPANASTTQPRCSHHPPRKVCFQKVESGSKTTFFNH